MIRCKALEFDDAGELERVEYPVDTYQAYRERLGSRMGAWRWT
jgi:hypothetical protein